MTDTRASVPDFLYGTAWKEERTPALTELALRTGFRGIDTANQRRHYFEAGVGQGLAAAYRAGVVTRADLFLQTKFTYQRGQDHRLPYDPAARFSVQVAQSLASSLEHLGTDYVDSFVLHGPAGYEWTEADAEVWEAMVKERDAGRTRLLGVSNVSLLHLEQMAAAHAETPAFVQNRCFARLAWDRAGAPLLSRAKNYLSGIFAAHRESGSRAPSSGCQARRPHANATPAQVVFRFAQAIGMLPLTGTSSSDHMKQDLASRDVRFPQKK
jgi:diketogulonate reductase-like aldo/keto reductase